MTNRGKPQEAEELAFRRVGDNFLGHSKPNDKPKPKKQKAANKAKEGAPQAAISVIS